ncbi:MAG: potassium channel protein [Gemmatimonadales bacterium]|nr:potassium channel protein [Gemmatimonadales bacterium]NIN11815.1 potassium channel protein [Gemmatimonadales bacterium]NIN50365.1 potassium channel protein [Gemmatimonadales bacterium]NIP07829.1 potassium channel protein [Gemmatimonadales bacterium]NIR01907.1 potassium channel protein [Gemmatimonadales bacterium]
MTGPSRPAHHRSGRRHTEAAEFLRLRRRLRLALGALILVIAIGVLGFTLIGGEAYSLVDAIYMTVITLTTVGFGEIIDMSNNPAGRVFTALLVLGGMGIVAYTVLMVAAFVIEGQLHNVFTRRRMLKTIADMLDHYIVCGDTAASWYVAEELIRTRRRAVILAPTETALSEAQHRLGEFAGLTGDPSDDDVLLSAGIERAAGLVFCMDNDKDNVLGVLTARRLAPSARIIAATEQPETEGKLRTVGADAVVSPSRIGGLRMASELVRPTVVTFLDRMLREERGALRIEEVTVPEEANVADRTLESLRADAAGALLLAVRHPESDEFEFKPPSETPLKPGMTLVVMADPEGHDRLKHGFRRATGTYFRVERG